MLWITHQAITGYQANQVNQVMQPKQGTQVSQQATVHSQRRDRRGPNFLLTILTYYVTVSALLLTPILFHFFNSKILQWCADIILIAHIFPSPANTMQLAEHLHVLSTKTLNKVHFLLLVATLEILLPALSFPTSLLYTTHPLFSWVPPSHPFPYVSPLKIFLLFSGSFSYNEHRCSSRETKRR